MSATKVKKKRKKESPFTITLILEITNFRKSLSLVPLLSFFFFFKLEDVDTVIFILLECFILREFSYVAQVKENYRVSSSTDEEGLGRSSQH